VTTFTAIASLLAVSAATVALAGEAPCAGDVARFCADVVPGGGRVLRCLDAHREELSPRCRATSETRLSALARRHPCATDRERFCPDVPTGEGRAIECLRGHLDELSASCRSAITRGGPRR
jgi:hypothetical protein